MLTLPTFPRLRLMLSRLLQAAGWLLLVLGLVIGLAWGALHFWIVPRISDFRPDLERLAQQTLGVPVKIGQISAESTGWAPSFELRDIAFVDPQGRTALLLPHVLMAISVRSVWDLKFEQLVLDAPELDIRITADGQWQVAGLRWTHHPNEESAAADWLFAQREVIVRGGILHWTNEHVAQGALSAPITAAFSSRLDASLGQAPLTMAGLAGSPETVTLRDVDLILRNSPRHHDVRLDATPPENGGSRFVAMGRFKRHLLSLHPGKLSDWTGQIYADFPHVDVAQLSQHLPLGVQIMQGQGSLRLWSDLANGQWSGGMADVNLTQLKTHWTGESSPWTLERLSGRLGAKVSATGFAISTQHLAFVGAQGLAWPGGNLALEYTHPVGANPAKGHLQADHLDLFALREMAMRIPIPDALHDKLQDHALSGHVSALQYRWEGDWATPARYDAKATLEGLTLKNTHTQINTATTAWPGLQGAQVQWTMNQDGGQLEVNMGADGAVFLPGILEEPILPVRSLHADVSFKHEAGHWHVPQFKLKASTADGQGQWQGQWHPSPHGKGLGVLELQGQIPQLDASRAHRYLPLNLPADVRQYVRETLVKGVYADVQIKLKGDLDQFPFADPKQGEFRIAGRLQDVEFNYLPTSWQAPKSRPWPRLHKLNGQLVFDRLGLKLSDASARAGDARNGLLLSAIQAEIPNMTEQSVLTVSAENKGAAKPLLDLVQSSPLNALTGGALSEAEASGNVQTRFKLTIPLINTEHTKVQGSVVLAGNDLRISPSAPWLEKTQGTVQFSETGFSLSNVQARMLGGATRIEGGMRPASTVTADNTSSTARMQLRAQGQITAEGMRQAQALAPLQELAPWASGSTTYTAQLGWVQGQPELSIQSTLEGLALKLPLPLGKTAAASLPVSFRMRSDTTAGVLRDQIQLDWGSVASAHYVRDLSGPEPVVLRGSLSLGVPRSQAPALPSAGVAALVTLERAVVEDWQHLLPSYGVSEAAKSGRRQAAGQSYLPSSIALKTNTLTADGRTLHQLVAGGVREGTSWRFTLDARELSGYMVYRQPSGAQLGHLYARLSRLNLPPSSAADVEGLLEAPPANLPALDIVVEELELKGKKLGRVEIEAVNTDPQASRSNGGPEWQLNKFNITVPEASFRGTGRWRTNAEGTQQRKTDMNFKLEVSDAGALLTRLGTPNALRGGSGQLEGALNWQGSPLTMHYPSLSGQLDVKMGRGQFLKADAGVAKLLGVLSLQALPRRLLLDFRDVFSEGFAFDSVRGDVSITQGVAQTRNLQIKGVTALVQLEGSADIAQETQKLRAVILPVVDAGTASLVAGIAVNPVVGLTAFLAQLFLQNPLAKANTQEFLIDGNWTEPRVTKITPGTDKGVPQSTP